ncbi:hypothetical protein, partial [Burkholderia oklahomensis]|uniref:hypothetical protein n=1 Tax=Burkholderia oklahomensis TaxID=342113 RepID=UPI0039F1EDC7
TSAPAPTSTSDPTSTSAGTRRSSIVAPRGAAERIVDRYARRVATPPRMAKKPKICDPCRMSTQYLPLSHFWRRF